MMVKMCGMLPRFVRLLESKPSSFIGSRNTSTFIDTVVIKLAPSSLQQVSFIDINLATHDEFIQLVFCSSDLL